jgi:hypothetical protein
VTPGSADGTAQRGRVGPRFLTFFIFTFQASLPSRNEAFFVATILRHALLKVNSNKCRELNLDKTLFAGIIFHYI